MKRCNKNDTSSNMMVVSHIQEGENVGDAVSHFY